MHHLRLKAAVEKYASVSAEELTVALQADDKKYTAEEIQEITAALSKPTPKAKVVDDSPLGKKHYQEWRVERVNGEYQKLKVIRERVLITDEQAATLNLGVEAGKADLYSVMYFPV